LTVLQQTGGLTVPQQTGGLTVPQQTGGLKMPQQTGGLKMQRLTGDLTLPRLLPDEGDLQVRGSVGRFVKRAAIDIFATVEKHVLIDIDQVVVDIDLWVGEAKRQKGLSFQIL
jgi:hypothetical protein